MSAKPKIYFATALALWDADFYVKVDDDVDVNIGKFLDLSTISEVYNQTDKRISFCYNYPFTYAFVLEDQCFSYMFSVRIMILIAVNCN